jgi:hypothetical protein
VEWGEPGGHLYRKREEEKSFFHFRFFVDEENGSVRQEMEDKTPGAGASSLASTERRLKEALEELSEVEGLVDAISGLPPFCVTNVRNSSNNIDLFGGGVQELVVSISLPMRHSACYF